MTTEIVVAFLIGMIAGAGLLALIRFLIYYFQSPSKKWKKSGERVNDAFKAGLESVRWSDD